MSPWAGEGLGVSFGPCLQNRLYNHPHSSPQSRPWSCPRPPVLKFQLSAATWPAQPWASPRVAKRFSAISLNWFLCPAHPNLHYTDLPKKKQVCVPVSWFQTSFSIGKFGTNLQVISPVRTIECVTPDITITQALKSSPTSDWLMA